MDETKHVVCVDDSSSIPWIPDESIALVVTSPPYPMIEMWDSLFMARNQGIAQALESHDGARAFRLMHEDLNTVWAEVARVLQPGGWACVNIGDATRKVGNRFQLFSNHSRIIEAFVALGFDILPLILWRKQTNAPNKFMGSGMLPAGAYVTLEHEYILIMRKGAKREFGTAKDKMVRQQSAYFWEERNKWFSDTWDFKGTRQALGDPDLRERSGAFPFELPYRLINMYSVRGDMILDPFLGTGTTTFAAMTAGRGSIGIEVDPALVASVRKTCCRAKSTMNNYIVQRIKEHHAFVERHVQQGGRVKYMNIPHGLPVITSQEINLELRLVDKIQETDDQVLRATYRPVSAELPIEEIVQNRLMTLAI